MAQKSNGKSTNFFRLCVEQPEKIPAGENIYQKGVINKYNPK